MLRDEDKARSKMTQALYFTLQRSSKHDKVTFEHTNFDNSIGMIMSKVSGRKLLSCTPTVFIQGLN